MVCTGRDRSCTLRHFYDSDRQRWYVDASWTHASREPPNVEEVIANGVVAVDANSDHLACWVVHNDGNPSGRPILFRSLRLLSSHQLGMDTSAMRSIKSSTWPK